MRASNGPQCPHVYQISIYCLFVFFPQGHDTTSAAIAWSIFLIGSHSEVQVRSTLKLDKQFVIREKSEMIDL